MDFSKYNAEINAAFPAQAFVQQFKDPKDDPTQTQMKFLQGVHYLYEKFINDCGDDSKSLLEFGGGPSLFSLISAAKYIESITFADYAETNRKEISLWKEARTGRKLYCTRGLSYPPCSK